MSPEKFSPQTSQLLRPEDLNVTFPWIRSFFGLFDRTQQDESHSVETGDSAAIALRVDDKNDHARAELTQHSPTKGGASDDRERRLLAFVAAHDCTLADVMRSAGVYKADLRRWRKGTLPDDSKTSERIEGVLSGQTPLRTGGKRKRRTNVNRLL